jgi:hypothetical protein
LVGREGAYVLVAAEGPLLHVLDREGEMTSGTGSNAGSLSISVHLLADLTSLN